MRNRARSVPSNVSLYVFCVLWLTRFSTGGRIATHSARNVPQGFEPVALDREKVVSTEKVLPTEPSMCIGTNNETGRCRHLKRCFSHEYRSNFTLAMNHACTIEQTYVGVCCAKHWHGMQEKPIDEENFAEILPLIAANDDGKRKSETEIHDGDTRIVWSEEEESAFETTVRPRNPARPRRRGCGTTSKSQSRLVGGRPADPTEWPWMVALIRKDRTHYCGGVLVTDRHVLTAAHCVYRFEPGDIRVRLGEYDFATSEETRTLDFAISEIRVHRDYDPATYDNDIAMIRMQRPTVFDNYIWPVCLPPIDQTFENKSAIVTGWGTFYYGGPASTVLMEVGVPVWPQDKCTESFVHRIPSTAMCAGAYEGGRDACQGDSGGPLLHQLENGRWVNIGIVSWGIRCGEPGRPGIYTRVSSYLDWIFENAVF